MQLHYQYSWFRNYKYLFTWQLLFLCGLTSMRLIIYLSLSKNVKLQSVLLYQLSGYVSSVQANLKVNVKVREKVKVKLSTEKYF